MTDPLFPFQEAMVERMVSSDRLFVAADMGLGKTRCAIEAASRKGAERVLVCAPSIGLVSWPAEVNKWGGMGWWATYTDPAMLPSPASGVGKFGAHYAIVPYSEIARRPAQWVAAAKRFNADVTVLDEAHYLKGMDATRTQAVYGWRADLQRSMVRADQVCWPMSGTPAPNFTAELWPHLHALRPDLIRHPVHGRPMSYQEFLERFATTRVSAYGQHVTGSTNTTLLRQMTGDFLHRIRKTEVRSEMPPILWTTEPLPVSAAAASHFLDFPEGLDDAGLLTWLRTAYPAGSSERKATGLAKVAGAIEWCRTFLEGCDRKLLVFAWHKEVLEAVHTALGTEFGSVMIHGDTPHKVRVSAVSEFQTKGAGPRLFCGQMLAAGTAITLTEASDVAFVEDDWTPGNMEQAAARADRLGQTRGVVGESSLHPRHEGRSHRQGTRPKSARVQSYVQLGAGVSSMIEITFTGETLNDLADQAMNFATTVIGAKAEAEAPAKSLRKPRKIEPEKAPAEVDPPKQAVEQPEPETSSLAAAAEGIKALEATKEKALDILRNVYNAGTEGQKAVRAILKDFGVKKAGDVPTEKADDLMTAARAALVEVKAE
jgi:hypothetical protein